MGTISSEYSLIRGYRFGMNIFIFGHHYNYYATADTEFKTKFNLNLEKLRLSNNIDFVESVSTVVYNSDSTVVLSDPNINLVIDYTNYYIRASSTKAGMYMTHFVTIIALL